MYKRQALISTGLVNAGFLALLRVYKLLAGTEVFPWVRSVLLIVGILSLGVGALFLRRTNNYKRFLSYSTVENMGIAAIGLGIGGIGVWAALFHVFCHTLVKSSLFLQMAVVRQVYDSYRINRIGDYIRINRVGAVGLLTGMVVLLALDVYKRQLFQHFGFESPVFHDLRRKLHEVALDLRESAVFHVVEQEMERMAEFVEERFGLVERQQRRGVAHRTGEVADDTHHGSCLLYTSWQMSFSWIPFGYHRSWSFNIGVKAASLSDLKYDKSQSMYDNMY